MKIKVSILLIFLVSYFLNFNASNRSMDNFDLPRNAGIEISYAVGGKILTIEDGSGLAASVSSGFRVSAIDMPQPNLDPKEWMKRNWNDARSIHLVKKNDQLGVLIRTNNPCRSCYFVLEK